MKCRYRVLISKFFFTVIDTAPIPNVFEWGLLNYILASVKLQLKGDSVERKLSTSVDSVIRIIIRTRSTIRTLPCPTVNRVV